MNYTQPDEGLSAAMRNELDLYLHSLRTAIIRRARELTDEKNRGQLSSEIGLRELVAAMDTMNSQPSSEIEKEKRIWPGFFTIFSPLTIVSVFLTFVFGAFGVYAIRSNLAVTNADSFLDIAKIFAGAIVGSSTSNVLSVYTKRRKRRKNL